MSGSVSAQLVLLLASPILTRLFTPADFGIFALFVAVSSILGMIANGRYEMAILLPDKDEEGFQIFQLCLWFTLIFSVASFFGFWGLQRFDWFQNSSISDFWWLLPLAIFLQGMIQTFIHYLNRHKKYLQISKGRLFGGISLTAATIGLGTMTLGAIGLILGKLFGHIVELLIYLFAMFKKSRKSNHSKRTNNLSQLIKIAKKYSNFLKFSTLEGLLNTFFKQIPVFGLTTYFGDALAGHYDLGQKVLGKPVGITGSSIGQVFSQEAAKMNNENPSKIRPFFLRNLKTMFGLVLPATILVMLLSPTLFPIIFGAEWSTAGVYAKWLMPFFAVTFLKAPLSFIIDIKNKLKENLLFEIGFVCISIFSFWFGMKTDDALQAIQIFSFGNGTLGLFQLYWFYLLTKSKSGF